MTKPACVKCGIVLQSYWLNNGTCNACRNPESIVTAVTKALHCDMTRECTDVVETTIAMGLIKGETFVPCHCGREDEHTFDMDCVPF